MRQYKTVVIGLGSRGRMQLQCFLALPDSFEIVGICDLDSARVEKNGRDFDLDEDLRYTDVDRMLSETKPEVMAFATMPDVRLSLVQKAAEYGIRGLIFEKPMASSLQEAREIRDICRQHGIKAIVCHQHKYLEAFRELRKTLDSGVLGEVYQITAQCQSQMAHIATHYIDYILWANGGIGAESVAGHVHGSSSLCGSHASPDYAMGLVVMRNGVRAMIECGYMSPRHQEHEVTDYSLAEQPLAYWSDCRLTVYGKNGYAYAGCGGQYGEVSASTGACLKEKQFTGLFEDTESQILFTRDFADWMDDDRKLHPCRVDLAYEGFEIFEAIYLSAMENIRVDLPLKEFPSEDLIQKMKTELPDIPRKRFVR